MAVIRRPVRPTYLPYVPEPIPMPFIPQMGTFSAAANPIQNTVDAGGGGGLNYSDNNERAAILRSLISGTPMTNAPSGGGTVSPALSSGGGGSSSGGGGWSNSGGGGWSNSGGGGGGGSSRTVAPVVPYHESRVQNGGDGWSSGGVDARNLAGFNGGGGGGPYSTDSVIQAFQAWLTSHGRAGTGTPVTGPGFPVDPITGAPLPPVTDAPLPPITTLPGYQIPGDTNFSGAALSGAALSVADPVFQQFLASQQPMQAASVGTPYMPSVNGGFTAASIANPYIPTINGGFSAASAQTPIPMSAASSVAPIIPSMAPPALNSGNLAGNYSEVGSDMFAEQPELLLRDMLNQTYGQDKAGGLYNMLEPYSDNLNALYLAQSGQDAGAGSKADFTNWLSSQWGNMQRPGTYTNTDSAIRNILNPSASSPLYAYVNEGDPQEQYRNTANLLGSAISMGYHPLFASAMMNRLKQAGLDYQGEAARGGAAMDPFYKYLQSSAGIPALSQLLGA